MLFVRIQAPTLESLGRHVHPNFKKLHPNYRVLLRIYKTKSKVFSLERLWSVTAEIYLIWTNVGRTNVACTNVTVTVG